MIVSHNRVDTLRGVVARVADLPVDEVIVVDNGSTDGAPELISSWGGKVSLLPLGENIGAAALNRAVKLAQSDLIMILDDDSYPLQGALEELVEAHGRNPRLGVAGGRVIEVDARGAMTADGTAPGSFDWFFRPSPDHDGARDGFPASFFGQCGCLVRREAFLGVGGCFEPYFFYGEELDLTARLVAAGWEVRYFPDAAFAHQRSRSVRGRDPAVRRMLRYRIRNQVWYFWLHFPLDLAVRRIPAYLAYDFIECVYRRETGSWIAAVADAWQGRRLIRGQRRPLERWAIRAAERNRGRKHMQLVLIMVRRTLARVTTAGRTAEVR